MPPPASPETYRFKPTPYVPNSILPVLVYRQVLPSNPTPATIRQALEKNAWIQGGVFKTYRTHHFHSVTHECYAVFKGSSRLLLGRGPLDDPALGREVTLTVGDIIILPVSFNFFFFAAPGLEITSTSPGRRQSLLR